MVEIISTAAALIAAFVLGYGLRGEREQTKRRALVEHAAMLEATNARLNDQLRVSLSISEHYLKQQFADDFAKRVAEGALPGFEQQMRSLHIYGAGVRTPYTAPPTIGGGGV